MDAVSQRRFGVRYYEAFVKREHVLKPIENEMELLERCISGPHTKREKMYLAMAEFAAGKMTDEEFGERMRVITVSSEAKKEQMIEAVQEMKQDIMGVDDLTDLGDMDIEFDEGW